FWGWDPKENGALMLVLGYVFIAHARMGGYLREHGMAVAAVALGIVVMWAFWGVNLYNVGLHSYGFTETKAAATRWYYAIEWTVVGVALAAGWRRLRRERG
ncbi:MAG: cytochrome C biogenesis protein, partial [Planctomycetes bacterium]|nr:cytochrome C biogenesis protein [Planctomycetota bacterium]